MTLYTKINDIAVGWDKHRGYFWGSDTFGNLKVTVDKRKIRKIRKLFNMNEITGG